MVVLAIIALIMAAVVPSINQLFSAGADAQAFNMLTAQLTAARARAIKSGNYTAVHVQLADDPAPNFMKLKDKCFMAVMDWNSTTDVFQLGKGFTPREAPGGFAFGEIRNTFVVVNTFQTMNSTQLEDFTTFTVVFSPSGAVVKSIGAQLPTFDTSNGVMFTGSAHVWADPGSEGATTAVTMFNYGEFTDAADRAAYLNSNAQLIPINVYTGQLFAR